jgi:glycosyltransferase involved in cell wall biosynthesis
MKNIVFFINYLNQDKTKVYQDLLQRDLFLDSKVYFVVFRKEFLEKALRSTFDVHRSRLDINFISYFEETGFVNQNKIRELCCKADLVFADHFHYIIFFFHLLYILKEGGLVVFRKDQTITKLREKKCILELQEYSADKLYELIKKILAKKNDTDTIRANAKRVCRQIFNKLYCLPDAEEKITSKTLNVCIERSRNVECQRVERQKENLFIYHDSLKEVKNQRYYRQAEFLQKHLPNLNIVGLTYDDPVDWPQYLSSVNKPRFIPKKLGNKKAKLIGIPAKIFALGWIENIFPFLNDFLYSLLMFYGLYFSSTTKHYQYCFASSAWSGLTGVLLKKAGKVDYLIYEDLDYYPGFFNNPLTKLFFTRIEKLCLQEADVIACVSEELVELRKRQTNKPVILSRNGVSYDLFKNNQQIKDSKNRTLIYTGSLDKWCGLDVVIQALPEVKRIIPNIKLIIIGKEWKDSFYSKTIAPLVGQLKLQNNVEYLGSMSYQELPQYLRKSAVGLIPNRPLSVRRYSCPLKLFEYLACGLPVLCTDIGEMSRIVNEFKVGHSVEFTQLAYTQAIIKILKDEKFLKKYQKTTQQAAQQFDWDNIFTKELEDINVLGIDVLRSTLKNLRHCTPARQHVERGIVWHFIKVIWLVFKPFAVLIIPILYFKLFGKQVKNFLFKEINIFPKKNHRKKMKNITMLKGKLPAGSGYTYAYPDKICSVTEKNIPTIFSQKPSIKITLSPNEWAGAAIIMPEIYNLQEHLEDKSYLEVVTKGSRDARLNLALVDGYKCESHIVLDRYLVKTSDKWNKYFIPLKAFSSEGQYYDGFGLTTKEFDFSKVNGVKFALNCKFHLEEERKLLDFNLVKIGVKNVG